jgi:hypothetical protein
MGPGGTLRMVFEADAWDSTISFAPGIPVMLGGTLELTFADNVNLASQLGRTFDLFNWTGVIPTGAFAISSPYAWDLSNLYTTGQVTLTAIPEPATIVLLALAAGICIQRRHTIVLSHNSSPPDTCQISTAFRHNRAVMPAVARSDRANLFSTNSISQARVGVLHRGTKR